MALTRLQGYLDGSSVQGYLDTMARFSGGPITHRAITGPRRTIESTQSEASWKHEVLYTLECIVKVRQQCDKSEIETVRFARGIDLSWTEIALALGITRQAAWERWHDLDEVAHPSPVRSKTT